MSKKMRTVFKILPAAILSVFIILAMLTTGCKDDVKPADIQTGSIIPANVLDGLQQSEGYCGQIQEIIQWQIDGNKEYRIQRDKWKETQDPRDEPQDKSQEILGKYNELKGVITQLSDIETGADTFDSGSDEANAASAQAVKKYYAMIDGACRDLDAVFAYYFAMQDALQPMKEFSAPESTTAYNDYALFAGQLSQVISQSQKKIKDVVCPAYMSDSHKDFSARLDEFQSFCQDFSIAIQLSDPLRISSCNYRMQRLNLALEKCEDALTDDFNLQFTRVAERLNGEISELRGELLNQNGSAAPTYAYMNRSPSAQVEYKVTEDIFPSLYRSLDALVTVTATCEGGVKDVLIEAEVPGFTQKYIQKITLTEQITKLNIRPPLLTGNLNLNSEKEAQLVFSVTDSDTGKNIIQDSKNITIKSKYDAVWWTKEYGDMNTDNILAWLTPEAPGVLSLKRNAIDYLSSITEGQLESFVGYQDYGVFEDPAWNTWVQAVAIQGAMSDVDKIRYNNASFSVSSDAQQRVMLPDDVVASKSGICIETSLLMASALQSAGMHVMLIFPPSHAQVAVETWPNTGEYFLIETTTLPMPQDIDTFYNVVKYMSKDEWLAYIDGTGENSSGECYVLDCDLGQKLGILPMSN